MPGQPRRNGGAASLRWIAAALVASAAAGLLAYRVDIGRAYARIGAGSEVVATPFGDIEYAQGGAGTPVLVVHGSGGGFDQGALIAQALLGQGFRWIAPSRFGYLRSSMPGDATFDTQADAFAALLDRLGIERVAVVAMSHGGPSALLFALRHPSRVSALVLVSCGVASSTDPQQASADRRGRALVTIFSHDPLYWGLSRLLRRPLVTLMGADADALATLDAPRRVLVERVIDEMNPVAPRAAGVAFDNAAAMPNARIAAIRAPTLVLHATDDSLQLFRNAEYAAATIPGARLVRFERGGHLLIAVEQAALRSATQDFIRAASAR